MNLNFLNQLSGFDTSFLIPSDPEFDENIYDFILKICQEEKRNCFTDKFL